jgi:RNA polymerase sigma-70 factor (ECF subfamily)
VVTEALGEGVIAASTVAEAMAGDTVAFARIVRTHHDDMARLCFVICGDREMAQDAVQAAWPLVWRKLGSLRDPQRLKPWLLTVAANQARQLVRSQRRGRVVEIEVADIGSSRGDPQSRTAEADLLVAFRRLSADDRALLAMRYVSGFDATEIGRALGVSPSGVRSRLSRLVGRLREELSDA